MATIRLANGGDLTIKLSLDEVKKQLAASPDFVELPGEDGPVLVRPSAVIAIIEDSKRGTAGFRVSAAAG
ncbi:MAG: hypothetical protein JOZ75_11165 [Candidatus Dormibacteraeota bacterium]|nr:hypothetical protein [Candidatus Dormibacteraeota bacterium]